MTTGDAPLSGLDDEGPVAGRSLVRCALCGHPLTGREARLRGLGDDCATKLGWRGVRGPGRFDVEQDGLFG